MRLTGGASVLYQQLRGEVNLDKIKCALHESFRMDAFVVCQTVDIYLADLHKISVLFGGMNDRILCMFLAGLPDVK